MQDAGHSVIVAQRLAGSFDSLPGSNPSDLLMNSPQPRLTKGPVGRQLIGMTVPVLFGIFTMMLQSFIDMWFIGQVGNRELAALSFSFPVVMVVTSVAMIATGIVRRGSRTSSPSVAMRP